MAKVKPVTKSTSAKDESKTDVPVDDAKVEEGTTTESTKKDGKDKSHPDADAYGRLPFKGLIDEEGKAVKLTTVPEGYNGNVHRPLLKDNFEAENHYYIYKAELLEKQAKVYRKNAADFEKLGSTVDRKTAKRLINMQKRMAELKAQLEEQGVNVDELLGDDTETKQEEAK